MEKKFFSLSFTLFFVSAFISILTLGISEQVLAQTLEPKIAFTEISTSGALKDQWVELRNISSENVSLNGVRFLTHGVNHFLKQANNNWDLRPGQLAIIAYDDIYFLAQNSNLPPDTLVLDSTWSDLGVNAGNINLNLSGQILATYSGQEFSENSIIALKSENSEWQITNESSPGIWPNTFTVAGPEPVPSIQDFSGLKINEILPAPKTSGSLGYIPEFIEIKNSGPTVDIAGITIQDDSGKQFKPSSRLLGPNEIISFPQSVSGITQNNDGDSITLIALNNANQENILDSINYESAPAGLSYARDTNGAWKWTESPTPGQENIFLVTNRPPTIKAETSDRRLEVWEILEVNASESSDLDGNTLTYTWNFGDGSKAETAEATHRYSSPGEFTLSLNVYDGEIAVQKTWLVRVKAASGAKNSISNKQALKTKAAKDKKYWPNFKDIFSDISLPYKDWLKAEINQEKAEAKDLAAQEKLVAKLAAAAAKEAKALDKAASKSKRSFVGEVIIPTGVISDFSFTLRAKIENTERIVLVKLKAGYWPKIKLGDQVKIMMTEAASENSQWKVNSNSDLSVIKNNSPKTQVAVENKIIDLTYAETRLVKIQGYVTKKNITTIYLDDGTGEIRLSQKKSPMKDGEAWEVLGYILPDKDGLTLLVNDARKIEIEATENKNSNLQETDQISQNDNRNWWEKIRLW